MIETATAPPLAAPTRMSANDGVLRFDATQFVQLREHGVVAGRLLARLSAPGEMRVCRHETMFHARPCDDPSAPEAAATADIG